MADDTGTAADAGLEGVETTLSPAGSSGAWEQEHKEEEEEGDEGGQGEEEKRVKEEEEEEDREEFRNVLVARRPLTSSRFTVKRSRLSPSPATGLIGLPENRFLDDFFGCLGFMGVASQRVIRDAMVSVMLASTPQCGAELPPPPTPTQGAEESDMVESNGEVEGRWSKAVPATAAALPRNTSTCLMWCAIALGALVRGCPLTNDVERYVDLAQDSLDACAGSASPDLVRAHVGMAILQSFLGEKMKFLQSLQYAESVLTSLPTDQVPERLRDLKEYASQAWASWVYEQKPDRTQGVALDGFWTDDAPIQKLPEIFGEEQVCSFFIHVDSRAKTNLMSAAGASIAKLYGPPPRTKAEKEGDASGTSSAAKPASGLHRDMLPEMMRVQKYIERSEMRSGIGALMFYGVMGMVQTICGDHAGAVESSWRALDVRLRYPGLFRVDHWLHTTHAHLWALASGPHRERYEELRAAYNPVRPEGSSAAPPYEKWTGISDICDHPDSFCRGLPSRSFRLIRPVEEEGEEEFA